MLGQEILLNLIIASKVKNSDKQRYVYSSYGITFDSSGSQSFDNDEARNVIIIGVDNSSSSHADNRKNNFLVLGEGPTFGTDKSIDKSDILNIYKYLMTKNNIN